MTRYQDQARTRLAVPLAILCLLVGAISIWLIQREEDESVKQIEMQDQVLIDGEPMDFKPQVIERYAKSMDKTKAAPATDMLSPFEVIDNPNCLMRMGAGQASDLALVVLPDATGARFSVVSQAGTVYGGKLPFSPNHYKLGKHANGLVVTGFGELRLNQKGNKGPEALEPVRVYVDGQLIYEREKVLWFDVAGDGSSYAVIEPLGGSTSQLLIHNLNEGTQSQYYLGNIYHAEGFELPYLASYSMDHAEVHFVPINGASELGIGTHYFFPVQSGAQPRKVRTIAESTYDFALLTSSSEGFFFYGEASDDGVGPFQMIKRSLDWSTGTFADAWSLQIQASVSQGGVSFSEDGKWMEIRTSPLGSPPAWNRSAFRTYLFDTSTGEPVFEFPTVPGQEQFTRLANVMSDDSTLEDLGRFGGLDIHGDQLTILRTIDDPDYSDGFRAVHDVFNMNTIQTNSQPDFRVVHNRTPGNLCASRSYPRSLQARGESLVFVRLAR